VDLPDPIPPVRPRRSTEPDRITRCHRVIVRGGHFGWAAVHPNSTVHLVGIPFQP
jgi:hypothetical protein